MNPQIAVQKVLRSKFVELQMANPRCSLRAFAKRVGLNPGAISAILNGRRAVSRKMAERISQKLLLSPQERFSLLSSFPSSSRRVEPTSDTQSLQLTSAQFRVLTEWEHFAILSLMNTDDFTSDCQWIAKRLGISPTPVEQAIDRLLLLKLITKSPSGRLSRSKIGLRTSDEVRDISIQKFHDQSLDLAKKSLHQHALEIRDFTATTFAIDPDKIPEAKAIIRRCQNELEELLETGRQREVYRFSTQLFPLTIFAPKTKKETPQ